MTTLGAYLRLARISNLPTVWSNVLAASALAGGLASGTLVTVALAMSLFYIGGMVLNDAFDRETDARERPDRPLPAGAVSPCAAWALGLGLIAAGVVIMASFGVRAGLAGAALAAAILVYDARHKGNPLAPFVMGLCRALVYVGTAAAAAVAPTPALLLAAAALLLYVAGLTFAAREEAFDRIGSAWPLALLPLPLVCALVAAPGDGVTLALAAAAAIATALALVGLRRRAPGDVGRAVSLLIATIALNDGAISAAAGAPDLALMAAGFFILTLLLQRFVPGT